jgi:hypothetical protein
LAGCSSAETQVCHRSYIIAASITGFVIRVRVLVLNATFNNILVILCTWWLVLLVQETGLRPRPLEHTKGVIRSRKSKERQYNDQRKREKRQTMIYKTSHRKGVVQSIGYGFSLSFVLESLKQSATAWPFSYKQVISFFSKGMNTGAPKVLSFPAIHMISAVLLLITNRGRRGRGRNPVSCTNKTNHHVHNITKILLKVAFLSTNGVVLSTIETTCW